MHQTLTQDRGIFESTGLYKENSDDMRSKRIRNNNKIEKYKKVIGLIKRTRKKQPIKNNDTVACYTVKTVLSQVLINTSVKVQHI